MRYFAARPAYTQTIATGVFAMGQRAVDLGAARLRGRRKAHRGRPVRAPHELAQECIEGAIWHTITAKPRRRHGRLPELSDYLAYVVLAPFLGAAEAARIVTEQRTPRAA